MRERIPSLSFSIPFIMITLLLLLLFGRVIYLSFISTTQRGCDCLRSPLVSTTRWFVLQMCVSVFFFFLSLKKNKQQNEAPQGIYFYSFRVCCFIYLDCERHPYIRYIFICECPQFIFINFFRSFNKFTSLSLSFFFAASLLLLSQFPWVCAWDFRSNRIASTNNKKKL